MKKTKFLLITCLVCTFSLFSYANQSQEEQIVLTGKSGLPKGPSRVPVVPSLEAYLSADMISVYFINDLGDVQITITDETGAVSYQSVEYSAVGYTAIIDISHLEPGFYTISFTNGNGLYLSGEFEYDGF